MARLGAEHPRIIHGTEFRPHLGDTASLGTKLGSVSRLKTLCGSARAVIRDNAPGILRLGGAERFIVAARQL